MFQGLLPVIMPELWIKKRALRLVDECQTTEKSNNKPLSESRSEVVKVFLRQMQNITKSV